MTRVDLTKIQIKAVGLLRSFQYVLLFGGSRSGKTRIIIEYMVRKCIKHNNLRAFIARQAQSHARASIWQETLDDVLSSYKKKYPDKIYFKMNHSDMVVKFVNGSRLYVAGLDDKERVEKILGRGFAIIYLNECSQIAYESVTVVKTRLAQKIEGFKNRMFFDENPPAPTHWSHKLFIEKIEPKSGEPLKNPDDYVSMLMNPKDNMENLPEDYITTLESLPERERRRFLYGEFVKVEGAIYDHFDITASSVDSTPPIEYYTVGVDNTGNNCAAVLIGFAGENVYILGEYAAFRANMSEFNATIYKMWGKYNYVCYPDPAAGPLNDLLWNAMPADNAVAPGINHIRELMEFGKFFILTENGVPVCPELLVELDSYRYDDKGRIVKVDDHMCLVGDTKIIVEDGLKDISNIKVEDKVLTPFGFKKVIASEKTGENEEVMSLQQGNKILTGTPNHPIFQNGSTIPLSEAYLSVSDTVEDIWKSNTKIPRKARLLYGMARDIINQTKVITLDLNGVKKLDTYIEIFGNTIMGLYPKGMKFTTRIPIRVIILLTTLNVLFQKIIKLVIRNIKIISFQIIVEKLQMHGTDQKKVEHGIKKQQESIGQNILHKNVLYVAKALLLKTANVQKLHAVDPVQVRTGIVTEENKTNIYNIEVEDSHCYYANGILVHNCDALRYGIYSHAVYGGSLLQTHDVY